MKNDYTMPDYLKPILKQVASIDGFEQCPEAIISHVLYHLMRACVSNNRERLAILCYSLDTLLVDMASDYYPQHKERLPFDFEDDEDLYKEV